MACCALLAVHRYLVAVCALATLLLALSGPPLVVRGWAGADAYTIVVLQAFDEDVALQEQFYNAPAGTPFAVSRAGYCVLDTAIHSSSARRRRSAGSHEGDDVGNDAEPPRPTYPIDPMLSTSMAYRGVKASDAPLPFRTRLSEEWVVWTKEDPTHGAEPLLLHCRLPLPLNHTETQQQQRRYVAQHAASLSEALETWWLSAPAEHASRCLYGDGEKALTGVERFYEVCPGGVVHRVQHHRLLSLLRASSRGPSGKYSNGHEQGGESPTVLSFLHDMHDSPSNRNAVLRNPSYRGIFEEIGRYDARYSKPRWNGEYRVWESIYPSEQRCTTHYTTPSSTATGKPSSSRRRIRPDDPYWKTVVRFRCPSQPITEESQKVSTWTVTEVRQLCEYHVELLSELVCGWEQELNSFNVNPVPCVVLE